MSSLADLKRIQKVMGKVNTQDHVTKFDQKLTKDVKAGIKQENAKMWIASASFHVHATQSRQKLIQFHLRNNQYDNKDDAQMEKDIKTYLQDHMRKVGLGRKTWYDQTVLDAFVDGGKGLYKNDTLLNRINNFINPETRAKRRSLRIKNKKELLLISKSQTRLNSVSKPQTNYKDADYKDDDDDYKDEAQTYRISRHNNNNTESSLSHISTSQSMSHNTPLISVTPQTKNINRKFTKEAFKMRYPHSQSYLHSHNRNNNNYSNTSSNYSSMPLNRENNMGPYISSPNSPNNNNNNNNNHIPNPESYQSTYSQHKPMPYSRNKNHSHASKNTNENIDTFPQSPSYSGSHYHNRNCNNNNDSSNINIHPSLNRVKNMTYSPRTKSHSYSTHSQHGPMPNRNYNNTPTTSHSHNPNYNNNISPSFDKRSYYTPITSNRNNNHTGQISTAPPIMRTKSSQSHSYKNKPTPPLTHHIQQPRNIPNKSSFQPSPSSSYHSQKIHSTENKKRFSLSSSFSDSSHPSHSNDYSNESSSFGQKFLRDRSHNSGSPLRKTYKQIETMIVSPEEWYKYFNTQYVIDTPKGNDFPKPSISDLTVKLLSDSQIKSAIEEINVTLNATETKNEMFIKIMNQKKYGYKIVSIIGQNIDTLVLKAKTPYNPPYTSGEWIAMKISTKDMVKELCMNEACVVNKQDDISCNIAALSKDSFEKVGQLYYVEGELISCTLDQFGSCCHEFGLPQETMETIGIQMNFEVLVQMAYLINKGSIYHRDLKNMNICVMIGDRLIDCNGFYLYNFLVYLIDMGSSKVSGYDAKRQTNSGCTEFYAGINTNILKQTYSTAVHDLCCLATATMEFVLPPLACDSKGRAGFLATELKYQLTRKDVELSQESRKGILRKHFKDEFLIKLLEMQLGLTGSVRAWNILECFSLDWVSDWMERSIYFKPQFERYNKDLSDDLVWRWFEKRKELQQKHDEIAKLKQTVAKLKQIKSKQKDS